MFAAGMLEALVSRTTTRAFLFGGLGRGMSAGLLLAPHGLAATKELQKNRSAAHVLVQFGEHRSGTSFQHTLLCAWAILAFPTSRVSCPFVYDRGPLPQVRGNNVYVFKTHRNLWRASWEKLWPGHDVRLFATAKALPGIGCDWRVTARQLAASQHKASALKYV